MLQSGLEIESDPTEELHAMEKLLKELQDKYESGLNDNTALQNKLNQAQQQLKQNELQAKQDKSKAGSIEVDLQYKAGQLDKSLAELEALRRKCA